MSDSDKWYVAKCPDCGQSVMAVAPRVVVDDRSTRAEISKLLRLGFSVERLQVEELDAKSFGHTDACKYAQRRSATRAKTVSQ